MHGSPFITAGFTPAFIVYPVDLFMPPKFHNALFDIFRLPAPLRILRSFHLQQQFTVFPPQVFGFSTSLMAFAE